MCFFFNLRYDFEPFNDDSLHAERENVVLSYSEESEKSLISFIFSPEQFVSQGF
ncbi:hypothetical protein GCM10022422_07470 [Flavobacterium ginsengisoli]|uniref:Uncharacterized protein n=1 Tax=Flavobacterium ginsengisoli TaxID=871694 RepID=A0ABP7F0Y9_9FLAO